MLDVDSLDRWKARRPTIHQHHEAFVKNNNPADIVGELQQHPQDVLDQLIEEWPTDQLDLLWSIYIHSRENLNIKYLSEICERRFELSAPRSASKIQYEWERLGRNSWIQNKVLFHHIRPCSCRIDFSELDIVGNYKFASERRLICPKCATVVWEMVIRW